MSSHIRPFHWTGYSAYPRNTLPGMGLRQFAANLAEATSRTSVLDCVFEKAGSALSILSSISEGQAEVGDLYSGGLTRIDPIFGTSNLPFSGGSSTAARTLLVTMRKNYEAKFEELGVHLLYVTPWPPTGLWSAIQIRTLSDLRRLKVRTYDELSAQIFRAAGAQAVELPIGEALEQLRSGAINALLSSGDGAAGTHFHKHLNYFYDVRYAAPVSFSVMHKPTYDALEEDLQKIVEEAAIKAELQLWSELNARILENGARMSNEGVVVEAGFADDITDALKLCARAVTARR